MENHETDLLLAIGSGKEGAALRADVADSHLGLARDLLDIALRGDVEPPADLAAVSVRWSEASAEIARFVTGTEHPLGIAFDEGPALPRWEEDAHANRPSTRDVRGDAPARTSPSTLTTAFRTVRPTAIEEAVDLRATTSELTRPGVVGGGPGERRWTPGPRGGLAPAPGSLRLKWSDRIGGVLSEDVAEVAAQYGLAPLPVEGGLFRRTWAGPADSTGRPAGSAILLLLAAEAELFSAMHRLPVDEVWHFYRGDPVELLLLGPDGSARLEALGPTPQLTVPAGTWMGAAVADGGRWALCGTTMAPGFVEADYEGGDAEVLCARYPAVADRIRALCRPDAPLRLASPSDG